MDARNLLGSSGHSIGGQAAASGAGGAGNQARSIFSNDQLNQMLRMGGVGSLFSGLFGDSGAPYEAAMGQYQKFLDEAKNVQNPFYKAGQKAIPQYQDWLKKMQDPSGFINNLMGQYQESPYAKYLQQQSVRAGINAASAGGLPNGMGGAGIGSTPFAQQLQQNAQNISSGDMNQWLGRVLGINTQFGEGQKDLMGQGANSANALTDLISNYGKSMGEAAYGKEAGEQSDLANIFGGFGSILSGFGWL